MRMSPCRHCTHLNGPGDITAQEICRVTLALVSKQRVRLSLGNWHFRDAHPAVILIAMKFTAAEMKRSRRNCSVHSALKNSLTPKSPEINPTPFSKWSHHKIQSDSKGLLPAPTENSCIHHWKFSPA